jgi:hypothetical protein
LSTLVAGRLWRLRHNTGHRRYYGANAGRKERSLSSFSNRRQLYTSLLFGPRLPHLDCNLFAQSGEEAEDALIGESGKMTSHELRYVRLGDSHYFGGPRLGKSLFFDEGRDIDNQISLDETNLGVRQANIGKDVTAAFCAYRLLFHFLPSMAIRCSISASLSLDLIFSISFCGVLIPFRDFF